jgi:hypothetical protein
MECHGEVPELIRLRKQVLEHMVVDIMADHME